jgi:hypothetical protein
MTASRALLPAGRREGHTRSRARLACAAASVGIALVAILGGSLTAPSSANAEIPVLGPAVKAIGGVGHAILHPLDTVVEGFVKILQAIFGGIEARLITGVINALLTIPNFDNGHVASLESTTVAIAAGMLSAVLSLSILRYYLAGLSDSGSGGFEALQALSRLAGAVGFIILWRGLFHTVVEIPRLFNEALLGGGSVQHNVALLFDAALVVGSGAFAVNAGIGLIFVIVIGFIAALTFIALLWMKVLLSVLLMFLYVSMPLAVVVWPIPELSWLAASAMKALFVALIVPCVWAILFALAAAVNADVLTWVPTHSVIDTVIVRPLAGITLMMLCLTIPRFLVRTAMIGPHAQPGRGRLWRMVTIGMLGSRAVSGGARAVAGAAAEGNPAAQRMIDALPSPTRPPSEPGSGGLAARMVFGRSGFADEKTNGKSEGTGGAGQQSEPERQQGSGPSEQQPGEQSGREAASASGAAGGAEAVRRSQQSFSVAGIDRPAFDRGGTDEAWQTMQARSQMSPPDTAGVVAAMGHFSPETQRGLASFQAANPTRMRQFAAQHVGAAGLSDGQRDALLALGSAPKDTLAKGMTGAMTRLDSQPASSENGAGAPAPPSPAEQPSRGGATSPRADAQPPASRPAAGSPGLSSGESPPAGRSLGADLPEQPLGPATPSATPEGPSGELPDPEPFLE